MSYDKSICGVDLICCNAQKHGITSNKSTPFVKMPKGILTGNRKQLDRTFEMNPMETVNYGYNDIYELESVTGAQAHTFDYDNLGNRNTADGTAYTPNNLNQYTDVGGQAYLYDDNGNLTDDGSNAYTYDEVNRLESAVNALHTSSYEYDGFNRRVSKTVDGVATYFVYDGDEVIAEYDASDVLEAEYVMGSELDEVLTMK